MKKKSNGEGSIRQRPNGTWEARVYAGGKRRSIYGETKNEVRRKLSKVQAQVDEDDYIEETGLTVAEWLSMWLEEYLQVRPKTRKRYAMDIRNHIAPQIGHIKLKDLTAMQVQHMYSHCRDRLSAKSVRNLHGILHSALHVAVNMDLIRRNVTERCVIPKIVQTEMHPLVDEDTQAFIDAIEGDSFRDLFLFDMFTGLRRGEVTGLTWDCVDFNHGTIYIYRQMVNDGTNKHRGQYSFAPLKNGKSRMIEPAAQVMDILRKVKAEQEANAKRLGSAYCNEDHLVFTYENGHHISDNTVYNRFKAVVRSIGKPEVRFHDLRHTFATLSAANGADMKTVSVTMGHATVAFTLDKYGHVSNRMRTDAAEKMSAFISTLNMGTPTK